MSAIAMISAGGAHVDRREVSARRSFVSAQIVFDLDAPPLDYRP